MNPTDSWHSLEIEVLARRSWTLARVAPALQIPGRPGGAARGDVDCTARDFRIALRVQGRDFLASSWHTTFAALTLRCSQSLAAKWIIDLPRTNDIQPTTSAVQVESVFVTQLMIAKPLRAVCGEASGRRRHMDMRGHCPHARATLLTQLLLRMDLRETGAGDGDRTHDIQLGKPFGFGLKARRLHAKWLTAAMLQRRGTLSKMGKSCTCEQEL
jgi:hypothetical protein